MMARQICQKRRGAIADNAAVKAMKKRKKKGGKRRGK